MADKKDFKESNIVSKVILPNEYGLRQELSVDSSENVLLRNTYDDEAAARRNYELRKDNPKGMNATGTMQHRAGIPAYEFLYQPHLRDFLIYSEFGDYVNAKKSLNKYLEENPQFKVAGR